MNYKTNSWDELFDLIKDKDYKIKLDQFLDDEFNNKVIFPERKNVFRCFNSCPFEKLKVIIIGQDPYHEIGQANGLAFSVNKGIKFPPSLVNIYKEIENEYGSTQKDGDLSYLADQGVLLLNKYLTVVEGEALSHKNKLYDMLFIDVIRFIESHNQPIVYMLWGNEAKKIKKLITNKNHYIVETNHPSPLSANRGGWFDQNQFIKCNEFLINNKIDPIKWTK